MALAAQERVSVGSGGEYSKANDRCGRFMFVDF